MDIFQNFTDIKKSKKEADKEGDCAHMSYEQKIPLGTGKEKIPLGTCEEIFFWGLGFRKDD